MQSHTKLELIQFLQHEQCNQAVGPWSVHAMSECTIKATPSLHKVASIAQRLAMDVRLQS